MKAPFYRSPVISVRADLAIGDCVRLMREHDIGSVVVESDDGSGALVGIFTERDILRKIDLIQHGGFWDRPVRTVMSRPVRTIAPEQIPDAGLVMLKYGFRHLPVVIPDENGKPRVTGIVTMRDLFRQREQAGEASAEPSAIGVVSRDGALATMLSQALESAEIAVRPIEARSLATLQEVQGAVIDVDGRKPSEWASILRAALRVKELPVAVVYSPLAHSESELAALRKLTDSRRFALFTKPINATALFARLAPSLVARPR